MSDATAGIANFLARYKEFEEKYRDEIAALNKKRARETACDFDAGFDQIKRGLKPINLLIHENKKLSASDFNIFYLLGVQEKELKHSAMLADLLNPEGGHSQGDLFLRRFIEYCQSSEKCKEQFAPLKQDIYDYKWFVTTEEPVPGSVVDGDDLLDENDPASRGGRLDLVVRCPQAKFLLAIENKIAAGEQPHQLERYLRWVELLSPFYLTAILIYLTPDGRESTTAGDRSYLRFSYREDVARWLNLALPDIRSHRLRETLHQYIELLHKFTGE